MSETEHGWMLTIPAGSRTRYRLAQLDDHPFIPRRRYPWVPPMRLSLEARVSSAQLPGTWGFGLWNDPYGFSFMPGNGLMRMPALPNAAWFFNSSPISYLSFRDGTPGNGFLAQVFSSPRFDPLLIRAIITFPFSRPVTRRLLSRIIREEAVRLGAETQAGVSPLDVQQWHTYAVEWSATGTKFHVDQLCVLDTPFSPQPPLGVVIWVDNQHAGFHPEGKVTIGVEANPEPAWLEIRNASAEPLT